MFTNEKNERSQIFYFLKKKIGRNALVLKSKKLKRMFGKTFILTLASSAAFRLQNHVSNFFYFVLFGDKRIL